MSRNSYRFTIEFQAKDVIQAASSAYDIGAYAKLRGDIDGLHNVEFSQVECFGISMNASNKEKAE